MFKYFLTCFLHELRWFVLVLNSFSRFRYDDKENHIECMSILVVLYWHLLLQMVCNKLIL